MSAANVVCVSLIKSINNFTDMINANDAFHHDMYSNPMLVFMPLYSWEYAVENKKLTNIRNHLIKIYNYYSIIPYETQFFKD